MDPLSATASVIAIIQLTNAVLVGFYRLQGQIKDAESEISRAISEVEDLAAVLSDLQDAIQPASNTVPIQTLLAGKNDPLESLKSVLEELSQKLAPLSKPSLKTKFRWPFESKGIQRMLGVLQNQKSTLQLALSSRQTKLLVQQSEDLRSLGHQAKKTKLEAVLKWYKTSDPEQNHRQSRSKHEPETGKWVFENPEFKAWSESEGKALWIHGIPGAGKTILCSSIIEYMQNLYKHKSRVKVVYYYFDFADSKKQAVASFLNSVIFQIASVALTIPKPALELFERCNGGLQEPTLDELFDVFVAVLATEEEQTFLMVDALDECLEEERRVFFELFFKAAMSKGLGVLITSRKEPDIETALKDTGFHNISIQSAVIDADVRVHVNNAISKDPVLQKWKPGIRQEILDGIVHGSQGMQVSFIFSPSVRTKLINRRRFRWAVCQLDTMKRCITPAMVRTELNRMPETLDQMYDRILQRIPSLHRQYVQSAMQWLAFSTRPLILSELAEAVAINPELGAFDPDESRLMDENLILELCGTLTTLSKVTGSGESGGWVTEKIRCERGSQRYKPEEFQEFQEFQVVSLSHYSVKEYIISQRLRESGSLVSYYSTSEQIANQFLAKCCLLYLLDFNGAEICIPLKFSEFPLLQYSSRFWMDHFRSSAFQDDQAHTFISRLFNPSVPNPYINWLNAFNPDTLVLWSRFERKIENSADGYPQPLYFASTLGDLPLVRNLIVENGCDVHAREGYLGSAFAAAAFHGHIEIVKYFLELGADANLHGLKFGTVLQTAAAGGSATTVLNLLEAGAGVNAEGGMYNTALEIAVTLERDDIVALLVKAGADVHLDSQDHSSSLYKAVSVGDVKMTLMLLAAGADINHIGWSCETALNTAVRTGSVSLVQTLLRKGADVNKGAGKSLPLVTAAEQGNAHIVRILLREGADPNNLSNNYEPPIIAAIQSEDLPTFRALLDSGADLNAPGTTCENPLFAALSTGQFTMAKMLWDGGVEFEDRAFLQAIRIYENNSYFLEKMLEMELNVDAHDGPEGSALHIAIDNTPEEVVWKLLSMNPYIHAVSENGSALASAINRGMAGIAYELICRGADLSRRGKLGAPFDIACRRSNLELAEVLLERGVDINGGGGAAIHGACDSNNEEALHFLIEHAANLNLIADGGECSPLQLAAMKKDLPLVQRLLELGADINGPSGTYGSMLDYALFSGDSAIISYFLDAGVDIVESEWVGSTLCKCLRLNMKELLPVLLEKGAKVNLADQGDTALGIAFGDKDEETMKLLVDNGAEWTEVGPNLLINAASDGSADDVRKLLDFGVDPNGFTPLATPLGQATKNNRRDIIDLLLEYGGDLEASFDIQGNALSIACKDGNLPMASYLISHGADPNVIKGYGDLSPLCIAAQNGNLPMIDLLLGHGADWKIHKGKLFANASFGGGENTLSKLLSLPLSPSEREICLDRALQEALQSVNVMVCSYLLNECGANPDFEGGEHGSPLAAAVCPCYFNDVYMLNLNDQLLLISLLLKCGARPNILALVTALKNRHSKAAIVLLDAGVNIDVSGSEVLQAAAEGTPKLLPRLLEQGLDVNYIGGIYGTALHAAAYTCNLSSIILLISHGADPSIKAGTYGSVIQAAVRGSEFRGSDYVVNDRITVEAMQLLFDHGASVTVSEGEYGTALQVAAGFGNLAVVKWLHAHGADPRVGGGNFKSVLEAARVEERWAVISYLEQHFGT